MEDRLRECPFCGKIPVWDSSLCGFIHDLESEEPPYCIAGGLLFDKEDVESWNTRAADPMIEEMARALDNISLYESCRGDDWPARIAKQALQEYRERKDAK